MSEPRELSNPKMEASLLGALMKNPNARKVVFTLLPDSDAFYVHAHRLIYKAIRDLVFSGSEPELTAVGEKLHGSSLMQEIGGADYLIEIHEAATLTNEQEYAKTVLDLFVRRNALRTMKDISLDLFNRNTNTFSALLDAESQLQRISSQLLPQLEGEDLMQTQEPFPFDVFPNALQEMIHETAKALPCDPGYCVLPMLTTFAACMGSSRMVSPKAGWYERPIIWGALVAEPSSMKTPVSKKMLAPLWEIESSLYIANKDRDREYQAELAGWRSDGGKKKGSEAAKHLMEQPEAPPMKRLCVEDVTIEAMHGHLANNPRGLFLIRDELKGWLKSFGRYSSGGGGGEESAWLEMWSGGPGMSDRKTGDKKSLFIPNKAACIYGTIQPDVLAKTLGDNEFENGMIGRFLFMMPARKIKQWTDHVVSKAILDGWENLCLKAWQDDVGSMVGNSYKAQIVNFTAPAFKLFTTWYDEWGKLQASSHGELLYALAKLEAYCARFALVLCGMETHLCDSTRWRITDKHVKGAIRMVEWFHKESIRVYRMVKTPKTARDKDRLTEFIAQKGGEITPRQLVHSNPTRYPNVKEAERALNSLHEAGTGKWLMKIGEAGGRPSKTFSTKP